MIKDYKLKFQPQYLAWIFATKAKHNDDLNERIVLNSPDVKKEDEWVRERDEKTKSKESEFNFKACIWWE